MSIAVVHVWINAELLRSIKAELGFKNYSLVKLGLSRKFREALLQHFDYFRPLAAQFGRLIGYGVAFNDESFNGDIDSVLRVIVQLEDLETLFWVEISTGCDEIEVIYPIGRYFDSGGKKGRKIFKLNQPRFE